MKTHGLTIKIRAKKPKNVSNCESSVSEWAPHIHARRLDALPLGFTQLRSKKLIERFLLAILPEPQRFAGLQVADQPR